MGHWLRRHIHVAMHREDRHFNGMQAFYINALMRALVFALVGVFTPLFVYRIMKPMVGEGWRAIAVVAVFYLLYRLLALLIIFPASKMIERIGFRWSVVLSVVFLSFYLFALSRAELDWRWLILASASLSLNVVFYWVSRYSVVILDSKKKGVGKQVGFLALLESLAGILGPLAGGFLASMYGFSMLYLVAMVILVFSVFPLFFMPHHIHRNGVSLKGYWNWIKDEKFFHQAITASSRAMDDVGWAVLWPFALSLMFSEDLVKMGELFSFLAITSVVVRALSGNVFDKLYAKGKFEDEWLFGVMAGLNALTWIVRMFLSGIVGVFWVEGTMGNAGTMFRSMSGDYFYLGGKRMSEIAYVVYRSVTYSIAYVLLMGVVILGAYFGIWRELSFSIIALWSLLGVVQAKESNLY